MELTNQTPTTPSDAPAKEPRPTNEQKGLGVRVEQSLAIGRYLAALDKYTEASDAYCKACSSLREVLENNAKFVAKVGGKHFLVERTIHGGFSVNPIELL